jgi:hypothetical protein
MKQEKVASPRPVARMSVVLARLLATVLLIPLALSACVTPGAGVAVQPASDSPLAPGLASDSPLAPVLAASDSALEELYGIQVTLVGITAAGGIIDFRYRVVDPDKAMQWLKDPKLMPKIVVEDKGVILTHPKDAMNDMRDPKAGEVRYMLYPNSGNVVKPGARVSIAIGDAQFGPYTAQQ